MSGRHVHLCSSKINKGGRCTHGVHRVVEEIREYVRREESRLVGDLMNVLKYPSISSSGEGILESADVIREEMERVGLRVEVYEAGGNPILFGEIREERHGTILFYNHYDVQPVDPLDEWTSPPFSPTVRDGRVFARGACDDKGHLMARLKALEVLMSLYGEVPVNVKFLVEGEEEVGSPTLPTFVKDHSEILEADACIWESGSIDKNGHPIVHLGAKGMLYLELEVRHDRSDLHSYWSPVIENPAWRLVKALASLRDEHGNVLVDGFYDDVEDLEEEVHKMLERIASEAFDEYEVMKQFSLKVVRDKLDFVRRLLTSPSINVSGISSGYGGIGTKTVISNRAVAKVDVRLVRKMDPMRVLDLIRNHLTKNGFRDVEVRALQWYPASRTPHGSPVVEVAMRTAEVAYGSKSYFYPYSPGSGPMYLVTEMLRQPCVGIGFCREDSRIHAPNENVRVDDYLKGIEHTALLLINFVPYLRWGEMPYL